MTIWTREPAEIVNDADARCCIGWDTDAVLVMLQQFIVEHTSQADFEQYIAACAAEDLANSGCDRCGVEDRAPGLTTCADCADEGEE